MPSIISQTSIDRERGRRSLYNFLRMAWPVIDPAEFVEGWHIELICKNLEACYRREIKRLVINIPPRHCKSMTAAVMFPVWCWINDPTLKFFLFSYALSNCDRDSIKARRLIKSEWFQKRWGDIVQLADDKDRIRVYETTKGGSRVVSSVNGTVTGEGADFLISDDPHNVVEGESPIVRDGTVQWWRESVSSRLNDQKTGVKIVIQQRVHDLDTAGEMIRDGYTHLVLPCEYDTNHPYLHLDDPRTKDGELLWPAKFGNEEIVRLQSDLGSYAYAGQYQQRPSPREGGMFEEGWFKNIVKPEDVPIGGITVRGWDIAAGIAKDSDWTVGVKIKKVGWRYFIMDVQRFKLTAGKLEGKIKSIVVNDGFSVDRHAFPQDPGASGKLVARNWSTILAGYPLRCSPESGEKTSRAMAFASQAENGNVFLVNADWNGLFIKECCGFPTGRFDDQVDASSKAVHEILTLERQRFGTNLGIVPDIRTTKEDEFNLGTFTEANIPAITSPCSVIAGPRY